MNRDKGWCPRCEQWLPPSCFNARVRNPLPICRKCQRDENEAVTKGQLTKGGKR